MLFDWTTPWKFLIFIIWFFRGETDQVSGTSFMLSSVVKFGQILPIGSTHFGFFFADFHWDMSGNLINIYNLHYNTVYSSEKKKITKTFTNCSFRTIFGQKLRQLRPCPKSSSNFFFLEITRDQAFRNFLLYQNSICFDWVMTDFLSCMTFCCQNQSFPVETCMQLCSQLVSTIFCSRDI